jgi:hypothetical protein
MKSADKLVDKASRLNRCILVILFVLIPTQVYTSLWIKVDITYTAGTTMAMILLSKFISRTCMDYMGEATALLHSAINIQLKEANEA